MNTSYLALIIGTCVMLAAWQLGMFFHGVPASQRRYYDRPATGFRLIWPLIRLCVHYGSGLIPLAHKNKIALKLKQAGVDFSLTADEFIAAQFIAACLMIGIVFMLFDHTASTLLPAFVIAALLGYCFPGIWLRDKSRVRRSAILRALPFYLDVITLAVESGSNLTGGLTKAVQKTSDSPLRREVSRVLRDIRSGKPRTDALQELAERTASPAIGQIVSGLIQSEKTGASLGPMLRAQAEQLRNQRFQYAEKKAMEAPVKLLAPLFIFIFPTTFLTLGFILLSKAILEGFITWPPLVWAYTWPGVS